MLETGKVNSYVFGSIDIKRRSVNTVESVIKFDGLIDFKSIQN